MRIEYWIVNKPLAGKKHVNTFSSIVLNGTRPKCDMISPDWSSFNCSSTCSHVLIIKYRIQDKTDFSTSLRFHEISAQALVSVKNIWYIFFTETSACGSRPIANSAYHKLGLHYENITLLLSYKINHVSMSHIECLCVKGIFGM